MHMHGNDKAQNDEFVNANLEIDKMIKIPLKRDIDYNPELGALSIRSQKLTNKGQEENFLVS